MRACVRVVGGRVAGTKCEVISLHRANRVNLAMHRLNAAAGGVVEAATGTVYRSIVQSALFVLPM